LAGALNGLKVDKAPAARSKMGMRQNFHAKRGRAAQDARDVSVPRGSAAPDDHAARGNTDCTNLSFSDFS